MRSRAERLTESLERVQRQRAEASLLWLRRARLDRDWLPDARALLTDEGAEQLADAHRERVWSPAETAAFAAQRAELAFAVELASGTPYATKLALEPYVLPFGREGAVALVDGLTSDGDLEGREHRARALAEAAAELAPRLIDLRMRALAAHESVLASSLPESPAAPEPIPGLPLPVAAPSQPASAAEAPAPADLARKLLDDTDDATRELTRWLVRGVAPSGTISWHLLLRALRAPELDGLAKDARRLARVASGLRGLGFERDLNARVRAEAADGSLDPRTRVIALSVPSDIRVAQSKLTFGVMSDAYAAHGVGQALALALISPALPNLLRRSPLPGVADALGMTSMQLRADPEYLRRIEGLEPLWVERLARHTGVICLLEARLQAALCLTAGPARSRSEWSQQLTAALERALHVALPEGLAALLAWAVPPGSGAFEACLAGLASHVALRDRYDVDWFRNPRVSEVVRGAAARGGTFTPAGLLEELGVSPIAASPRLIELIE
jgi:hypothetical protein